MVAEVNKEEQNHQFINNLVSMWEELDSRYLDVGKQLMICRDEKRYQPMYDTFGEFCTELKTSEATAIRLIQIYKQLHKEFGIDRKTLAKAGWSNLADVLSVANSKSSAEKWVKKASELRRVDLRKELKEKRTGIPMDKCKHKDTYTLTHCRDCGEVWRSE